VPKPFNGDLFPYNSDKKLFSGTKDELIVKLKLPPNKLLTQTRTWSSASSTESKVLNHLKDRPFALFPKILPYDLHNNNIKLESAIPEQQRTKRKPGDERPRVLDKRRKRKGRCLVRNAEQKRDSDYERIEAEKERVRAVKKALGLTVSSLSVDENGPAIETSMASRMRLKGKKKFGTE